MLLKQVAQGDERVFLNVKNVEATSITTGMGVSYRVATAGSFDGNQAVRSDAGNTGDCPAFIGIASQDIASNAYGLVQVFGFVASVLLSHVGTSITINSGNALTPGDAPGGLFSAVPTYLLSGFKYVLCTNPPAAISASGYCSGLIPHI